MVRSSGSCAWAILPEGILGTWRRLEGSEKSRQGAIHAVDALRLHELHRHNLEII